MKLRTLDNDYLQEIGYFVPLDAPEPPAPERLRSLPKSFRDFEIYLWEVCCLNVVEENKRRARNARLRALWEGIKKGTRLSALEREDLVSDEASSCR